MSDSIWKKELSFKRKPKPEAAAELPPDAAAPSQSLWKKELSLKKKKEKVESRDTEPRQSVWKKDISLKKKEKAASKIEPDLAEPKQSFWKKDISLKKKEKAASTIEPDQAEPKQSLWKKELSLKKKKEKVESPDTGPKQSVWKKEISFSRREREREVERLSEEAVQAFFAPAVVPEPPSELLPTAIAEATVAAMPEPAAPVEPVSFEPVEIAGATEPEPMLPVELSPIFDPVASEDWLAPQPVAAEPEPWLAEPVLPSAPEAAPTAVVHPPVPAPELPEVGQPKVPFWKKELSFGRGSTPVARDAPTEALPVQAASAPFWKRELSLSLPKLSRPGLSTGRGGKSGHSAKRFVGLKIGSSQLAAARISNNGSAELLQLAREPLAHGVVVAGELREPDALADALKAFFARHKLPRKNVRLGIASNRIGVRIFDLVGIDDEKQLANAVQFRAQEALPIPLDEAVLDYRVLEDSVDDEGRVVKRVLLVVAYRDLIDRYAGACRKAGIGLVGIDLEAFALLRSLAAPTERGAAAMVAVAIGHDRSTFAVTDGRVCEFTRVLEWGGWSLNVALARALDAAPSEVELAKCSLSLDDNSVEGLTPEQSAIALDAVRRQLQSFARELVSSLQFYQNQPGSLAIGSIVITGGTAHMPGLAQELQRLIGVHVEIGNPLARVRMSKRIVQPEQLGSLAVAIGLAIED